MWIYGYRTLSALAALRAHPSGPVLPSVNRHCSLLIEPTHLAHSTTSINRHCSLLIDPTHLAIPPQWGTFRCGSSGTESLLAWSFGPTRLLLAWSFVFWSITGVATDFKMQQSLPSAQSWSSYGCGLLYEKALHLVVPVPAVMHADHT
jgi:hypothetical protein